MDRRHWIVLVLVIAVIAAIALLWPRKIAEPARSRPPVSQTAPAPAPPVAPEMRPAGAADAHVEGNVRDSLTGAPVAGVDVVFAAGGVETTASADASGHFGVDLGAGRYAVRVTGAGVYGLAPAPLVLGAGTHVGSYDLRVARLASVRGRVLDADGQPAAGAQVSFRSARLGSPDLDAVGLPGTAVSGADGGFELRVVPGEVTLSALREGRRGRLVLPLVEAGQTLSAAEIVLDAGGGLIGTVVDPGGRPVAEAQVVAAAIVGPGGLPARATASTDGSGHFTIHDLPPGKARVEARAPGFAPSAALEAESAPDARELVLTLRPARVLRGRVLAPDGRPLAGANVVARRPGSNLESPVVTTAADGSFELGGLDAGPHDLEAMAEGYASAYKGKVSAPAEGIELRLQANGGMAGVVSDAGGKPVADFQVRWQPILLAGDAPGRSGELRILAADGAFRVEALAPGAYDLAIAAPGFAPAERRVTVAAGALADASVRLGAGATLFGRIVGDDGAAVAGAKVSVMTGHEGDEIQSDRDGRFTFDDVAPGRRSLDVDHPEYVTHSESGIVLRAGERREVTVTLTRLKPGEAARPGAHPMEIAGIGAVLRLGEDGVVLADVVAGGPAERAGLTRGDLVLRVEGEAVEGRTLGDITEDIRGVVGTAVRLEVLHAGQRQVFDVVRGTVRFGG
jgi:Carboxypeptidase regulatory-like domain/PDZ domain